MHGIELRSLIIVYADCKIISYDPQMDGLAIIYLNLNRFAHSWQPFFIVSFYIKLIFPRFQIDRIGFQRQYCTPDLTIEENRIIFDAAEIRKNDF